MMWFLFLLFILFSSMSPIEVSAEQRWLTGQVLHKQGTNNPKPVKGAVVMIVNVGNPYATGDDGGYRVVVPDAIQFGQTIRLHVKKSGWGIDKPEGGKFELPRELTKDIFALPESSSEFLSASHIDQFLHNLPELTKTQVKFDGKREEVEPTQVVKDYASEHDISYQETLLAVEKRVTSYEQEENPRQRCLAAIYRKDRERISNLCKAGRIGKVEQLQKKRQEVEQLLKGGLKSQLKKEDFSRILVLSTTFAAPHKMGVGTEESKSKQSKLNEAKRELVRLTEEVVDEFRLVGDAHYINYEFANALNAYEAALTYVSKEEVPTLWADVLILMGNANAEIGVRTSGASIHQHLGNATRMYRQALTVYRRDQFPQAWATTQNNLGATLREQGTRTGGEDGTRLLAEAVAAYRAALTVSTKEQLPQQWAATQNNLGATLGDQGIRTGGEDGTRLLAEAVAAYKAALEVRSREHLPEGWAQTHNNLAEAYLVLEDWTGAVESYRKVLTLYPDYAKGYALAQALYHEKLFAYGQAFELTKEWLLRHPDDLPAQANFAEAYFTNGQFAEAESRLAAVSNNDSLKDSAVPLRVLQIAALSALKKETVIPEKLTALRELIAQQSNDFKVEWSFEGTKHFIANDDRLASSRDWLLNLLSALEGKDRDGMLAALDKVQSALHTSGGP